MNHAIHARLHKVFTSGFSLTGRIYLAAFTTLLTVVLCLLSGFYTQRRIASLTREILDVRLTAIIAAHRVRDSLVDYDSALFRYLTTRNPRELRTGVRARQAAQRELERLRVLTGGGAARPLIQDLRAQSRDYFDQAGRLLRVAQKGVLPENAGLFSTWSWMRRRGTQRQRVVFVSTQGRRHLQRVFELSDKLLLLNQRELALANADMNEALKEGRRIAVVTGASACGLTLLAAVGLAASLLGPINELMRGVERVERGDLDFEIPVATRDEVGRLTRTFNRMARTVREQRQRLLHETITDGLTGAYNQRHFRTVLKQEIERAERSGELFSLFMIDVDHFKDCNDLGGHEFGNEVLKMVFNTVRDNLRDVDLLARYGGDELAVILPNTPPNQAQGLAERIARALSESGLPGLESMPKGRVTLSIGGAAFPRDASSAEELVVKADRALYAAKTSGRDCTRWAA